MFNPKAAKRDIHPARKSLFSPVFVLSMQGRYEGNREAVAEFLVEIRKPSRLGRCRDRTKAKIGVRQLSARHRGAGGTR